jgi:hypothetical protein
MPFACAHCGEPFTPARSDARYCSGRCRVAAHRAGGIPVPAGGVMPASGQHTGAAVVRAGGMSFHEVADFVLTTAKGNPAWGLELLRDLGEVLANDSPAA